MNFSSSRFIGKRNHKTMHVRATASTSTSNLLVKGYEVKQAKSHTKKEKKFVAMHRHITDLNRNSR
jgi:hypothetical protein